MLFNSYVFIFAFLPVTFLVYFGLAERGHLLSARYWLIVASLFFYGWWNISYVPLILGSILFNFGVGQALSQSRAGILPPKLLATIGISANVAVLGYFKYANFFIENIQMFWGNELKTLPIVLPLAISFFTFQQIAYLADCYAGKARDHNLLSYTTFVCFFPQLIAGPIVHHGEMMPQFSKAKNYVRNHKNIMAGLLLFAVGLFKKVVVADTFAIWATYGFDQAQSLSFVAAWATSFSYTFQLYFDFSGYTDMAIGAALLFNIKLPTNFNSPYKALSIRQFWQHWHMTLSRFLRDYVYIPLGGNRAKIPRVYTNIFLTFLLGGLWHGAAWTFVLWGALHGGAMLIHRAWQQTGIVLPRTISWALTFLFVNMAWVFFRATDWPSAKRILAGMSDVGHFSTINGLQAGALVAGFVAVLGLPNSNKIQTMDIKPKAWVSSAIGAFIFFSILIMEIRKTSEFLYFQF